MQKHRKIFHEYQVLMEKDQSNVEITRCKETIAVLNQEKESLKGKIELNKRKREETDKKQKEQEIKLQELDKETQSKQKDQQTLWEEECRKSQLSEQMIEWIESENFHTGQEILQELDSQLKKVEGILKQYILTEKKNMENIMQIIDDPGR